ncbi:Serine/threonine-protein kinase PAK 3, partial [Acanthisitta chloris]
ADFGVCAWLTPERSRRSSLVGTAHWLAPEIMTKDQHGPQVDIWALGITCIEMLQGGPPYYEMNAQKVTNLIAAKGRPELPKREQLSPAFQSFLDCCLQTDEDRLLSSFCSLTAFLFLSFGQHPFLQSAKPLSSLTPMIIAVKQQREERR